MEKIFSEFKFTFSSATSRTVKLFTISEMQFISYLDYIRVIN